MSLLPCPFCCGAAGGPIQSGGSDERSGYNFVVKVRCSKCGAQMKAASHQGPGGWCDDTGEAERQVIAAWNARCSCPSAPADSRSDNPEGHHPEGSEGSKSSSLKEQHP